jgi:hypothetical protein
MIHPADAVGAVKETYRNARAQQCFNYCRLFAGAYLADMNFDLFLQG